MPPGSMDNPVWETILSWKAWTITSGRAFLQVLIPPQEAIQTVDISTSNYDAELGRSTGGAVNLILKSVETSSMVKHTSSIA